MTLRIADNLPVATRLELSPYREAGGEEEQRKDTVKDIQFEHGYRLGFVDNNKVKDHTSHHESIYGFGSVEAF